MVWKPFLSIVLLSMEQKMDYKTVCFTNPQERDSEGKYFPYPVYEKTIGLDDFVKEIGHATSLTPTDVRAVLAELVEVFQRYLVRGNKLKISGIGTFKVSFKGTGKETAEEVNASSINRESIRITFVSDSSLKKLIRSDISFKKVTEKNGEKNDSKNDKDSATTEN